VVDLSRRNREEEWMDGPDVDPADLARSLRFIRRVNSWLGYTRVTISHLERFRRGWPLGERIAVLDVATGSADIPRAIVRWAQRREVDLRVVGLDRHERTARMALQDAQSAEGPPRISIVRGDAMDLPFADQSFDYVITNMFLHHLDDRDVIRAMREMDRVARRGIVAADLVRNRRAYLWISLFTLFSTPMLKHDARVSVAQAFTRDEIERLRDRAGIDYARCFRHFGHRFILAGEKPMKEKMARLPCEATPR
jgi:SAM-dependent methyltransferase